MFNRRANVIIISEESGKHRKLCLLLVCLAMCSGCFTSSHIYQVDNKSCPDPSGNQPSTEWQKQRMNIWLWGLIRHDIRIDDCVQGANGCERLGIEEIKITAKPQHVFIAILTLGIYVPMDVSWRCNKPRPVHDTLAQ